MSNSGHPKDSGRRRGLMLVLSSPSGAGKTTLARKLIEEFHDVNLSVSATTRPPRPNEVDGVDYHFRTVDDFHRMIERREFLEWAHVFDKYYGTPKADTVARLEAGEDVLFDVDWQGADALHDQMPNDVVSVFILPPSISASISACLACCTSKGASAFESFTNSPYCATIASASVSIVGISLPSLSSFSFVAIFLVSSCLCSAVFCGFPFLPFLSG